MNDKYYRQAFEKAFNGVLAEIEINRDAFAIVLDALVYYRNEASMGQSKIHRVDDLIKTLIPIWNRQSTEISRRADRLAAKLRLSDALRNVR